IYRVAIESPNLLLAAQCVELGLGVSIVPGGLVNRLRQENKKIVPIALNRLLGSVYIVLAMSKNKKLFPYQRAFIDILLGTQIIWDNID
ncbi:LysR family transcriptional regulator substrate-binding protein, partial [Thermodesulfobacteriota bacterium]